MSDSDSDAESWDASIWEELELQMNQILQSNEEALSSLHRVHDILESTITITHQGREQELEAAIDDIYESSDDITTFWSTLLQRLEEGQLV